MMAVQAAHAQQQPAKPGERIEVTGSRIPMQQNVESTSPIAVISADDIKVEGVRNIENLLNNMPQVFADQGSTISNGASGTATVNLRNLGAERTLVLINGRRLPAGSPAGPYAADLNQIPAPLIQRVEILTGGASSVYGSDAIAGVVNFILRRNFEGVQGEINHSFFNHQQGNSVADIVRARSVTNPTQFQVPGDKDRDGESTDVSLMIGGNFGGGRGNATLFLGYKEDEPLLQSERDYSACALAGGNAFTCAGSSTSFPGRFFIGPTFGTSLTVADAAGNTRPFNATTDLFNYGPYNYYQRPSERYTAYATAHYDVNRNLRVYGEYGFHDDHTNAVIAPSGSFGERFTIRGDNPLLSAAWRTALGLTSPTSTQSLILARRNIEGGGRNSDIRHTSNRFVVGVKGDFMNWDYDVFAQTSKVIYQNTYLNDFSVTRLGRAIDVITDPATGQPACRSAVDGTDPACVPWNIWRLGGVTPAAISYLQTPGFQNGYTSQTVRGIQASTDLGHYGIKLPGASTGVGLALGAERRHEELVLRTDLAFQLPDLSGQGGPTLPLSGEYTVKDFFGEVRVPIMDGKPMADILSVNASYRYSDISTGKTTDTYGLGIEWAPNRTVKVRGSHQRAIRAANLIELFQAQGFNLFDSADPCAGPTPTATREQCRRTGLPDNLYGANILLSTAGQYNFLQGGNPDLDPEEAKSNTIGLVLTPMNNLSATLDYFDIEVEKVIDNIPPALALTQCIASGQFCNLINRGPLGTLWLPNDGFVTATNQNLAKRKTSGFDIAVNYNHKLGGGWGGLGVSFIGTYLREWKETPVPGLGEYDCAGLYGNTCGVPLPEWRHKLRFMWETPWKGIDMSLTWRYFDEVKMDTTSSNPLLSAATPATDATLKEQNYIDIAAAWAVTKQLTVRAGVNNLFDKDPPLTSTSGPSIFGNGNTFPQVYDAFGRKIFVTLTLSL